MITIRIRSLIISIISIFLGLIGMVIFIILGIILKRPIFDIIYLSAISFMLILNDYFCIESNSEKSDIIDSKE